MSDLNEVGNASSQPLDQLLFDEARNIDTDNEYWFSLRGNSINKLIDAATPLIGMVLRIRSLGHLEQVTVLYENTVDDIKSIEVELVECGYDNAVVLAYRYVLCAFIDEAIMSTDWGSDSHWAEHSLLTRFHSETWGGEKVFSILQRIEGESVKYQDLLEFMYLCFCLGFQGRYKVMANGREEFDRIVTQLYEVIRSLQGEEPLLLSKATQNVADTKYKIGNQLPVWTVFAGFAVALTVIFVSYSVSLSQKTSHVLAQLLHILQ